MKLKECNGCSGDEEMALERAILGTCYYWFNGYCNLDCEEMKDG